jgi:hypothetical protein
MLQTNECMRAFELMLTGGQQGCIRNVGAPRDQKAHLNASPISLKSSEKKERGGASSEVDRPLCRAQQIFVFPSDSWADCWA